MVFIIPKMKYSWTFLKGSMSLKMVKAMLSKVKY